MCVRGIDFSSVSTIFPILAWNCSDGVVFFVSHFIVRYPGGLCIMYLDFLDRGLLLTNKRLPNTFMTDRLKSSLLKFCGHFNWLVGTVSVGVKQQSLNNRSVTLSSE